MHPSPRVPRTIIEAVGLAVGLVVGLVVGRIQQWRPSVVTSEVFVFNRYLRTPTTLPELSSVSHRGGGDDIAFLSVGALYVLYSTVQVRQ